MTSQPLPASALPTSHTVTLTFDVSALNEGAVEDFILEVFSRIEHEGYYSQSIYLTGNNSGKYTL